MIITDIKSDLI